MPRIHRGVAYFICGLTVQNDISRFAMRYNTCGFHVFYAVPGFSSDHSFDSISCLQIPIRFVSISVAVTLRCLLCDQKFTDSLRGKMPMDLPCNAVLKECKRRRTGGAGGTTKAHLDSLLGRQTGNCGGEVRLVLAMHPRAAPVFGVASTSREQNSSPRSSTRILHVSVHKDTQQII